MPLVKGKAVSNIFGSNGKKVSSVSRWEVICAQTKSPRLLILAEESTMAGLSLVLLKSVNGKCTNTMSRC